MTERTAQPACRIAVPLANPANVWPLVTLACGVAGHEGGDIVAFCVLKDRVQAEVGGERSPVVQARQRLAMAVEAAHRWEVPVRAELVVHPDVAGGIVEMARSVEADLLVMGWHGGLPRRMGFGPEALDRVVEQAGCDVAILKPAPRAGAFRRILVAALRGEHDALAMELGSAVADRFGAEIHRLELVKAGASGGTASAGVSVVRAEGEASGTRARLMVADSTPEGILGAARGFDLVVVGTGRRSLSRQLLHGNRLEAITRRTNASILVVRTGGQKAVGSR